MIKLKKNDSHLAASFCMGVPLNYIIYFVLCLVFIVIAKIKIHHVFNSLTIAAYEIQPGDKATSQWRLSP